MATLQSIRKTIGSTSIHNTSCECKDKKRTSKEMIRIHCLKCDLYFYHHEDTKKHWEEVHGDFRTLESLYEYYKLEIVPSDT